MARGKSFSVILILLASLAFYSAPARGISLCGDSNGDGQLNVGDAVYMINYVFKGGPAPDSTCCAGNCLIDDVSIPSGDNNPENKCEYCDPELNQYGWTLKICNDYDDCTDDSCDPSSGICDYVCVPDGTPCEIPGEIGECSLCACTATSSQDN